MKVLKINYIRLLMLLLFLLIFINQTLISQVNSSSDLNNINKLAQEKQFDKAIIELKSLLENSSEDAEAQLLLAKLYAWNKQYELSKLTLTKLISNTNNQEALSTYLNVLLWNKEYNQLLNYIDTVKNKGYNDKYDIFIKSLLAYDALNQDDELQKLLNSHLEYQDSLIVKKINIAHTEKMKKNAISAGYVLDFFETTSPMHLASIEYSHRHKKSLMLGRFSTVYRNTQSDNQLEFELYQKTFRNDYLFLNIGSGFKQEIFPKYRLGAAYYHVFESKTELAAGYTWLKFKHETVGFGMFSLAQYYKQFYVGGRFYFVPEQQFTSTTQLFLRIYDGYEPQYTGITLGYGTSAIERLNYIENLTNSSLLSYTVAMERNQRLGKDWELKLGAAYHYEEYYPGLFRNRYQVLFNLKYKL